VPNVILLFLAEKSKTSPQKDVWMAASGAPDLYLLFNIDGALIYVQVQDAFMPYHHREFECADDNFFPFTLR